MARFSARDGWDARCAWALSDILFALLLLVSASAYAGDVTLAWDPVTSPLLAGYAIHYGPSLGNYPNAVDVGNVTTKTITNLTEGATYNFVVAAYDSAHSEGGFSNNVVAMITYTVPVANFSASTVSGAAPLVMNFIDQSTGSITTYAWTFGDGTTGTTQNPAKTYSTAGTYSVGLTVTGPGGSSVKTKPNYITATAQTDTTAPSAPTSLTATANGSSGINLGWAAATDNVGVTGYRVERCQGASCTTFTQIAAPTTTSFGDSGLAANTTYRYRVRASDAAANLGAYSPISIATTTATLDTTAPSAPASLTATANGSSGINLSWAAATDNVGVTGYRVERCQGASCTIFTQIAAPTTTSFGDSGLAANTTYRYRVRASDAAANLGAYSPINSATTTATVDTTAPSAPASLTATANGSSGINLSWAASTDNVGVTGYRVERCQGASCTIFTQIAAPTATSFSDSGLSAGTTYGYSVRANDATGNLGAFSNVATTTTATTGTVPIAYVQNNYATPQSAQVSVPVIYKSAQTAGNLNVVVVGWNDTNSVVTSVTDTKGNVYTRAVGPTTYATQLSQSIYYAKNIASAAANANIVTVQFSTAATYADVRVVEYAGIDRVNPVDVVAVGSGSGTTSATAAVTTTSASTLLFGASTVRTLNTGPGSGFTSRVITSPDGDIVEDRIVTSVGSYNASAPMTSGGWVMQLVGFRGM